MSSEAAAETLTAWAEVKVEEAAGAVRATAGAVVSAGPAKATGGPASGFAASGAPASSPGAGGARPPAGPIEPIDIRSRPHEASRQRASSHPAAKLRRFGLFFEAMGSLPLGFARGDKATP